MDVRDELVRQLQAQVEDLCAKLSHATAQLEAQEAAAEAERRAAMLRGCAARGLSILIQPSRAGGSLVAVADPTGDRELEDRAMAVATAAVQALDIAHAMDTRYRRALEHIASGNISPSIDFARNILEGMTLSEAHERG